MIFSSESDVWASGVTMFEIFSEGTIPYPGMVWDQSFVDILEGGFWIHKRQAGILSRENVHCYTIEQLLLSRNLDDS